MQVIRIFTDIFISPSLSLRQYPDRYTFRAGRNLPDKEFRYLRTVIVTAAVHQGFSRQLCRNEPTSLTFWHWAGVSPHTSSCDFAETCVFGKQSPGSLHCGPFARALFLPKVQSQFAEFLRESYLAPLSLFNPRTCVGLRYRRTFIKVDKLFLEKMQRQEVC